MADGFYDITCASFTLRTDERCALRDATQSLAKIFCAAYEGNLECVFVDVMFLVRRREDFRFVDIVDSNGLDDLLCIADVLGAMVSLTCRNHTDGESIIECSPAPRQSVQFELWP